MNVDNHEEEAWPNRGSNLYVFLADTTDGKSILRAYADNKTLTSVTRNLLTRLVIRSEKDAAFDGLDVVNDERKILESFIISSERLDDYASQIVQFFPGEYKETYYTKCRTVSGACIPQAGKLWDHYNYTKKVLREKGLLAPSTSRVQICSEISDETLEKIVQLGSGLGSRDEVLALWNDTFDVRRKLLDDKVSIVDYFQKFPCLSQEIGKDLIGIDFEKRHPGKSTFLFDRWNQVKAYLITQLQQGKLKDVSDKALIHLLPTLDSNAQDAIILNLLPHIAQGTCVPQKKTQKKRKIGDTENEPPSRVKWSLIERRQGFILHVENATDITTELETRGEQLRSIGLTRQPLPVFVGPTTGVEASYVSINEVLYEVESPLHALDMCFKLFVSLDCSYPVQASSMWIFLQKAVYDINYPADFTNRSVNVLMGGIKRLITVP